MSVPLRLAPSPVVFVPARPFCLRLQAGQVRMYFEGEAKSRRQTLQVMVPPFHRSSRLRSLVAHTMVRSIAAGSRAGSRAATDSQ